MLLCGGWTLTETAVDGGVWYEAVSPADPIPFGTFGPMLRIDFDDLIPAEMPLFTEVAVDNTVYTNAQTFVVEGYEPAAESMEESGG